MLKRCKQMKVESMARLHYICRAAASAAKGVSVRSLHQQQQQQQPAQPRFATIFDVLPENRVYAPQSTYKRFARDELIAIRAPPRAAIMSTRGFIDMALYNKHFGYFSRKARILHMNVQKKQSVQEPINFQTFWGFDDFCEYVNQAYIKLDDFNEEEKKEKDGQEEYSDHGNTPLWHTPVELFKPWYGHAVARRVLEVVPRTGPVVIYEIGGGNGTLMTSILDYFRANDPEVYERVEYHMVEVSMHMAAAQKEAARNSGHELCVKVAAGYSALAYPGAPDPRPCVVLAFEVADNLSHDGVCYDLLTKKHMRSLVSVSEYNELEEVYEELKGDTEDARACVRAYKLFRVFGQSRMASWFWKSQVCKSYRMATPRDFVPSSLVLLFEQLKEMLPQHKLILSDFASLPHSIKGAGRNKPVVQARLDAGTVPVSTYLVQPGAFDIFFPTDFEATANVYRAIMHKDYNKTNLSHKVEEDVEMLPVCENSHVQVISHKQFLQRYATKAELANTCTRAGDNPMLSFYANAKFLVT